CDAAMGKYTGGGTIGMALTGNVPTGSGCAILWNYGGDPMGVDPLTVTIG
ncbi:MAG: hypothetical protein QOI63_914, partial [Thermoplasmata archaeon]|nr:hypothetical protein [Thermoplasmata archaeon]